MGNGALCRIYDGSRPATGAAITTQTRLAELTLATPPAASASGGVLTLSSISPDTAADATGTAAWFRIVKSDGTFVMDGSCGTSGSDLNLATLAFVLGDRIEITSFVITAGNA